MAKSPKFTLKLLIDEKKNKVVLAEADQDFVDVLISLLTLPMGTIARRLENHKTVLGCYKNLNKSVADMVIDHFETEACKRMLMYPRSTKEIHCKRLKLNMGYTTDANFYMCPNFFTSDSCTNTYSEFCTSRCSCGGLMSSEIQIPEVEQVGEVIDNADGVFVKCRSSFIVTDDLNVTVNSLGVVMKVLSDLGYLGFRDLQEKLLDVGFEEVVTLLGCLFTSEAPLTDAFLKKQCMKNMRKMLFLPVSKTGRVDVAPIRVFAVKLFVRKGDREIIYAECNEDFIDYLLTFLVLPLELAFSLSNDDTILGCVRNLVRSQCRRASASNFLHLADYYSCSNDDLLGYFSHSSPTFECLVPRNKYSLWSYSFARMIKRSLPSEGGKIVSVFPMNPKEKSGNSSSSGAGFMKKNTKFIVSNDLVITPMNSSSTIGLLKKMHVDFSDLEEHQILA